MTQELAIGVEAAVMRARKEAEILTEKLDRNNAEKDRRPLMASRDAFVDFLTIEFTKLLVHRAILT